MNPKILVLTGGIGSGKSRALKALENLGYKTYSLDDYSRDLYKGELLDKVAQSFPEAIRDGALDRKVLGKIIAEDEARRLVLNNLTHSKILEAFKEDIMGQEGKLAVEIPLYGEVKDRLDQDFIIDKAIYIDADEDLRAQRIAKRENISLDHAYKLIKGQRMDYLNRDLAQIIIKNNGTDEDLLRALAHELGVENESF